MIMIYLGRETCVYLERVLIAKIEDEDIGIRTPQPVITIIRPFQGAINREIGNCRQIRNFQLVKSISQHDTWIVSLPSFRWPVLFAEFTPHELL